MKLVEMDKPEWKLTLWTAKKDQEQELEMELTCFRNVTNGPVRIVIEGSPRRYGVVAGGDWYCVLCNDQFVATFRTILSDRYGVWIQDGELIHEYTEDSTAMYGAPADVYSAELTLLEDGSVLTGGYRWSKSPAGYPFVMADGEVALDSHGNLLVPEDSRQTEHKYYRYIFAHGDGGICITPDRGIFCRNWRCPEFIGSVVDVCELRYGFLLLTKDGYVYFTKDGHRWDMVGKDACAIHGDEEIVIAYQNGDLIVYEFDRVKDGFMPVLDLSLPGREISEVFVNNKMLVWKYTDGRFEVRNR